MINPLLQKWHQLFGAAAPDVIVRAPGRVNIIGEHTDYNEGWVLPGAMDRALYLLVSKDSGGQHHWIAHDLNEEFEATGPAPFHVEIAPWAKYVDGAIRLYAPDIGSLKILIGGDLPVGAGVSSSSALVCGLLFAFQQLTGRDETKQELALTGSRVEREIIGLQGGIMDQYAIMLSQPDHVMLLDCHSGTYRHIQASLPGCKWLLVNTKVKHQLINSDYNQRALECRKAVDLIRRSFPTVSSLRDVTTDMLSIVELPDVLYRRTNFVLQENHRVHLMVGSLESKDPVLAGLLLTESHMGLRHLYEVSCEELDHLADLALQFEGVYGGRMMGGGFGGCVLYLLREDILHPFIAACTLSYVDRFGFEPEVIQFHLGQGVERVKQCRKKGETH